MTRKRGGEGRKSAKETYSSSDCRFDGRRDCKHHWLEQSRVCVYELRMRRSCRRRGRHRLGEEGKTWRVLTERVRSR